MQGVDYTRFLRRWAALVIVGTVLALLAGYSVGRDQSKPGPVSYTASAIVAVNYVQPAGAPYNPTLSPRAETLSLRERAADPALQQTAQRRAHVAPGEIESVAAIVQPDLNRVTVQVQARTVKAARALAIEQAQMVADIEIAKVDRQRRELQAQMGARLAAARKAWQDAQAKYYRQSSAGHVDPQLAAQLDILRTNYQSLFGGAGDIGLDPQPAAIVSLGPSARVVPHPTPLWRTLALIGGLGFVLSLCLAAVLDYAYERRRSRRASTSLTAAAAALADDVTQPIEPIAGAGAATHRTISHLPVGTGSSYRRVD